MESRIPVATGDLNGAPGSSTLGAVAVLNYTPSEAKAIRGTPPEDGNSQQEQEVRELIGIIPGRCPRVTAGRSKLGRCPRVTASKHHNFAVQYSVQTPLKTIHFAEEQKH